MVNIPQTPDEYRACYEANIPEGVEWGECWCGCGTRTKISTYNNKPRGWYEGQPRKFAPSHRNRFDERYTAEDRGYETPCWIWSGYIAPSGYGMLPHKFNGTNYAHRWRYEVVHGKQPSFPRGQLHHRCEQKSCINPEHLTPLTVTEHRRTYNTKLTHEQASEIRQLYSAGKWSQKQLAELHRVSRATIINVLKQRIWREPHWDEMSYKEAKLQSSPDIRKQRRYY